MCVISCSDYFRNVTHHIATKVAHLLFMSLHHNMAIKILSPKANKWFKLSLIDKLVEN